MTQCQIFSDTQLESLRKGGSILRGCLNLVSSLVEPGITTKELDEKAEEFIRSHEGATPGFKGYNGFPATLCTSINEQCVHGIPGDRVLKEGDIISMDCGVIYDHLYTDACVTIGAGAISAEDQKLMDATEGALDAVVAIVKEGIHIGDISSTIQKYVEERGFVPVRSLTGHGLGSTLHQFPDIPNHGEPGTGPVLPARTLIAVEPIISAGDYRTADAEDGWTLSIRDGANAAHFEHTLFVTEEGCEVIA